MASNQNQHNQLVALFAIYTKRLEKLYNDFVTKLIKSVSWNEDKVWDMLAETPLFRFDDLPYLRARLQHIFDDYFSKQVACYKDGITDGVALAYLQDNINLGKYSILQDKALYAARTAAVSAFITNRMERKGGLSLSDKVWNYAQLGKSEVEIGISNVIKDGLKKGTSAEEIGRKVRQYLNNPTMMYRRYWVTVSDNAGNKKKVARWYRRHIDEKTGKVTFKDEPLERVGAGIYRSARKNSNRLMRTEVNMAYHKANSSRWENEPFVYGIRVWLSPQHPEYDICDELAGYYPKDFVFTGWHPQCLCASAPLTLFGDEKRDFYRRLMKGEDMSNFHSKHEITKENMNPNWARYIKDQHKNIIKAAERGKLAYHLRDNQKYWLGAFSEEERKRMGLELKKLKTQKDKIAEIAAARHAARTPEKERKLREWWSKHKRIDGMIRDLQWLRNGLKDYPIIQPALLQKAIDERREDLLERFLQNKLLRKKLDFERNITPHILHDSVMRKKYGNAAVDALYKNTARTMSKYKTLSIDEKISKYKFEADWVLKNRSFSTVKEVAAFYEREAARLSAQKEFEAIKKELEILQNKLSAYGGKPLLKGNEWYGDVQTMKKVRDDSMQYASKIDRIEKIDNFINQFKPQSPVIRQLREGIEYAVKTKGLGADIDDMLSKLEKNIARLEKAVEKRIQGKLSADVTLDELQAKLGDKMPETLKNLQKKIDAAEIVDYNSLPANYKTEFSARMKELFANSDFAMNVPRLDNNGNDVIDAIFSSYFKNQIETKTGKGMVSVEARKKASERIFGTDISRAKAVDYEKYGFLADKDILKQAKSGIADQYWSYGDGMQIRFKKDKVITTFTMRDSLGSGLCASLTTDPRVTSMSKNQKMRELVEGKKIKSTVDASLQWGTGYIELQYHGKLTLDCIESVYIPKETFRKLSAETMHKIAQSGAKVYTDASARMAKKKWIGDVKKLILL